MFKLGTKCTQFWFGKPKGNSSIDVHGRSWKNIIKLYLIEFGYWDVDYIRVAQESDQWEHVNKFRDLQRSVVN